MNFLKDTLQIIHSSLSAMIGIQNKKNLERDFQRKSMVPFVIAGVIFSALFVVVLVTIVRIILAQVGSG